MIETNRFFLQKEGVNRIVLRYKIGTQSDRKSQKRGSSPRNLLTMPKYGSTPPPPAPIPKWGQTTKHKGQYTKQWGPNANIDQQYITKWGRLHNTTARILQYRTNIKNKYNNDVITYTNENSSINFETWWFIFQSLISH